MIKPKNYTSRHISKHNVYQRAFFSCYSLGSKTPTSQSQMPLQAAVSPRQYLQDATLAQYIFNGMKCLAILSLVIPIGMAEYCLKIGRIPPKSEWLAAMLSQQTEDILNIPLTEISCALRKF